MVWAEIQTISKRMATSGTTIELRKVESHPERPRKNFPNGIDQDPVLTFKNNRADHWAGEGAKIHSAGLDDRAKFNGWIDATATVIQKRLLCVASLRKRHKKNGTSLVVIHPNEIDTRICDNRHDFTKCGSFYRCLRCCQMWHKTKRNIFSYSGECPGPGIWGLPPENLDVPRKIVHGYKLYWNGSIVNDTHRMGYLKGLLFCWGCGAYSQDRVKGLSTLCPMKPINASAAYGLTRIKRALFPDSRRDFVSKGCCPPAPSWLCAGYALAAR